MSTETALTTRTNQYMTEEEATSPLLSKDKENSALVTIVGKKTNKKQKQNKNRKPLKVITVCVCVILKVTMLK